LGLLRSDYAEQQHLGEDDPKPQEAAGLANEKGCQEALAHTADDSEDAEVLLEVLELERD
jgi:hypothetical protein